MYERTILCLANSRKTSGRCIAGKVWEPGTAGPWIRPVSARPLHEVSVQERRYEDGNIAVLLDIISMPLLHPQPFTFQHENHMLDPEHYWQKVGTASWSNVQACLDPHDAQFWSQSQSTYHGLHDKIAEADVANFASSLKLVEVADLQIHVVMEDGFQGRPGKRKVRGHFTYAQQHYQLSVSDADLEDAYLRGANGVFPIGRAILCVSLVEVFHGFSFRVIASVITPQRCGAAHA